MAMERTPRMPRPGVQLGAALLVLVVIHSGKHFRMLGSLRSKSTGGEAPRFPLWLDHILLMLKKR